MKDMAITRDDVLDAFRAKKFKEVIIGNRSVRFLRRFDPLPPLFSKILNGNILCGFYDLEKLAAKGFRYYEPVFPFQTDMDTVARARALGLECWMSGILFSKESYWRKIRASGITHVSSDFI